MGEVSVEAAFMVAIAITTIIILTTTTIDTLNYLKLLSTSKLKRLNGGKLSLLTARFKVILATAATGKQVPLATNHLPKN